MKEFMMLFHHVPSADYQPSPEEIQAEIKKWQDWIGDIASQGKFVSTNQLAPEGKTLTADHVVTDGPYSELKEIVGGYIIINANDFDDALEIAKGCPVLVYPNSKVEIRPIMQINV